VTSQGGKDEGDQSKAVLQVNIGTSIIIICLCSRNDNKSSFLSPQLHSLLARSATIISSFLAFLLQMMRREPQLPQQCCLMWGTRGAFPLAAAMVGYGCVG
jgi:hypothetical protein